MLMVELLLRYSNPTTFRIQSRWNYIKVMVCWVQALVLNKSIAEDEVALPAFRSDLRIVYYCLKIKEKFQNLNISSHFNLMIYRLLIEKWYSNAQCMHSYSQNEKTISLSSICSDYKTKRQKSLWLKCWLCLHLPLRTCYIVISLQLIIHIIFLCRQ